MSNWRSESAYLARYAGSGVLNTIAGFTVIILLMEFGVSPFLANTGGYLFGLILGFFVSKKLVFQSEGHITSEGLRYLTAFLICFFMNLFVLQFALNALHWDALPAQLLAAAAYTVIMYLLTRLLVFRAGINSSNANKQD